MSDAYASKHILKSLPIHGMALTSTGRKIEHSKVVVVTRFSTHSQVLTYTWDGFDKHWQENRAQQGSGCHPNIRINQLNFPLKVGTLSSLMCSRLVVTPPWVMHMLQYTFSSPYLYMGWLWQALAGGRKIEHSKVVVVTQTFESISSISLEKSGLSHLWCVAVLL